MAENFLISNQLIDFIWFNIFCCCTHSFSVAWWFIVASWLGFFFCRGDSSSPSSAELCGWCAGIRVKFKWVVGFGRQKKMSKLYIGNLAAEANEAALRQLLQESGVGNVSSVLVKRGGYAFIDCPEQSTVDRAIEKLNGKFTFYSIIIFVFFPFVKSGSKSFKRTVTTQIERSEFIDWSPTECDSGAMRRTESTMFLFYSDQYRHQILSRKQFFFQHKKNPDHIVIAMRFSDQHLPPTSVSL